MYTCLLSDAIYAGSLKNVISSKSSSPLREVTETTRLIRAEIVTNEHINEDGGDISPLHTGKYNMYAR